MKVSIYMLLIGCLMAGCKEMDDNYKDYLLPGGVTYPGKANSVKFHPGYNRATISWLRGPDPLITKARIYWNNFTDSVEIPVAAKQDSISHTFTNLEENDYTYHIRTFDDKGNGSVAAEVSGPVYGPAFESRLLNRPVNASTHESDGTLVINWGMPDTLGGAVATDVTYINIAGNTVTKRYFADAMDTEIPDHKPGTDFELKTLFVPGPLALDTFHSPVQAMTPSVEIPRTNWTATASNYETFGQLPVGGPPEFVLDGRTDTYWHSRHTSNISNYPYWLAFDMKTQVKVTRVELNSRPDYFTSDFYTFNVEISDDGVNWRIFGSYRMPESPDPQAFVIAAAPVTRYIRLYMLTGQSQHCHLAEFKVYGLPQ